MKFVKIYSQRSGQPGINSKEYGQFSLSIPVVRKEQYKISSILSYADNLIVANEKKGQQLKGLKKLLMEKIFSQAWRFKGFSDPWEQRKLNEIAVINPSESLPSRFNYIDLDAVNHGKITKRKELSLAEAPSRAQRVAHLKDVFFQNVRPYQKNNVIYSNDSIPTVFSSGYTQIRTKIDSEFMISALEDDLFVHSVLLHSTGTSYPAISSKQLGDLELSIPEKEEAERIGGLFNMVDSLIVANEKKLDQLKQLKKYLMQNMFV
ncbi:restriction endonuclease subunit S domain-containing protein [Levilactobacillus fuyuanensis]|uniref:Restriction endonuclease subunit S n=1 Tax=Levilactobacillus fuyuanensis TaxID=2486022 RepID=A0ABW4H2S8_9LACO|nr:restriction endonuclease subunit S [Levilactobacillus fuyuanensis]